MCIIGSTVLIFFKLVRFHILLVSLCPKPDLLACYWLPSYVLLFSPQPPSYLFTPFLACITVSSLRIPYIPLPHTHVCVSLLEVDRGCGGHVWGLRLEFELSSLNWTTFLEASQFCGNSLSWQDKMKPDKYRKSSCAQTIYTNLQLTYKRWI